MLLVLSSGHSDNTVYMYTPVTQLCVNCYCELIVVVGSKPGIGMGTGNSRRTSFPSQHQRAPEMEGEEIYNSHYY